MSLGDVGRGWEKCGEAWIGSFRSMLGKFGWGWVIMGEDGG